MWHMASAGRRRTRSEVSEFRLSLDGEWYAADLASLLRSLDDVYNLLVVLDSRILRDQRVRDEFFPINRRRVPRIMLRETEEVCLGLPRIRYASPGMADITGAGEAMKQLKEFILGIADRVISSKDRDLDRTERALKLERIASENRTDEQSRELELALQREQLREAELQNIAREVAFTRTIEEALRENKLPAAQQAEVVHWIGSRAYPMLKLADRGKLKGTIDGDSEQS